MRAAAALAASAYLTGALVFTPDGVRDWFHAVLLITCLFTTVIGGSVATVRWYYRLP